MTPEQQAMWTAGTQLATTGINAIAQSNLNRKQREWNEKQYNIQRTHALQDWQMQQEYNSPTAQMRRLQEAGLNPNLIYGSGGATTQAQPVRGTESKSWNPSPVQLQMPDIMGQYQSLQLRNAQADLLKEDIQNRREQRALLAAQRIKVMTETDTKNFDLELKQKFAYQLAETQNITAELNRQIKQEDLYGRVFDNNKKEIELDILRQTKNNTIAQSTINVLQKKLDLTRTQEQTEQTRQETERIKEAIKSIQADTRLKELDYDLYTQRGFTRNAPYYVKAVADAIDAGDYTNLKATLYMLMENKYPGQTIIQKMTPNLRGKKVPPKKP